MPRDPDDDPPPWTRGEVVALPGAAPVSSRLWIDAAPWSEIDLPRRPWIVRGYLIRGSVTLLAGAGSAGKSMLLLGWSCALALGRTWGAFNAAAAPRNVMVFNVEDDRDEQRLRLSAALRQWGATPADVSARIVRTGPTGSGMLLDYDPIRGVVSPLPLMVELRAAIAAHAADVVILDPLVELHGAGENDNTALRAVVAYFRSLAVEYGAAVVIAHHTRKGTGEPGDPDAVRGASAVIGAARVVLTMQVMSNEDAGEMGVPDEVRRDYARLDGAKSNYAPARDAEWFRKEEYHLDNDEWVSAVVPWSPPKPDAAPQDVLATIMAEIERGVGGSGEPWSPKLSGDPRSIRTLLRRHGVAARKAEASTVEAIEALGAYVCRYRTHHRQVKQGYRTPNGPPCKWIEPRE